MGSLNSIEVRNNLRSGMTERIVADGSVALRIRYIGKYSVTSVVVTTATNIVLTPSIGTAVTCTFATYDSMGEVADYINNSDDWSCQLLDVLRSDVTTASPLVAGTKSVTSAGYYNLPVDTSVALHISYRCAYDRSGDMTKPKGAHRVHLKGFTYYADLTAAVNKVQIWEYDPVNQSETQIYQALSVTTSSTAINFASGEGWISSGFGNDLIVRVTTAGALSDEDLEVSYDRE